MFMYVSLALVAITAFFVLFNLIKGLIRGFKKTIGSLVAIILSAIIAFIATTFICDPASGLMGEVVTSLEDLAAEAELADIFGIEALGEAITYYVAMIAAPFVFMLLYSVVSIIVSIIVGIVIKFIPPHKKPKAVIHRLGGMGVGILCGLLVSAILLTPVVGVIDLVITVGESGALASEEETGEGELDIEALLAEASEDDIYALYSAGCGWVFDALASASFDGERIYLKDDIAVIISVIGKLGAISGDAEDFSEEQINSLDAVFDEIDRAPLLRHTMAGFISTMASNWLEGKSFLGTERIEAGELLNPIIDTILGVLAQTNKDYVIEDMKTLTGILGVFAKHDMFANSGDFESMLDILGGEGVIAELLDVATQNERMSVISDQITQLSIRALASTIGIPSNADERYNLLMSDIALVLNDSAHMSADERAAYVEKNVAAALDEYGISVGGQASKDITTSIISDLGNTSDLDGKDVSEFFIIYAVASVSAPTGGAALGFDKLSGEGSAMNFEVNADGTVSFNGVVLENYDAASYGDSAAYTAGKNHVSFDDASTLYSAKSMRSSIITLDDLLACIKAYGDCNDKDVAADDIAKMIQEAVKLADKDFDGMDKAEILEEMAGLLDIMKNAEVFSEVTPQILKAIFQTDVIRDAFNHDINEINTLADHLNENANKNSYADATSTISVGLGAFDTINDPNATKEEKNEATKELMNNMTPENAEFLSKLTTPSMMLEYVNEDEEKAKSVSESVTHLFNNMADYKEKNPSASDEQVKKEADAVNAVLHLAIEGSHSDKGHLFTTEDEAGKADVTAYEYVELIVESDVVSNTVSQTLADNPDGNPFGATPSEEDAAQLSGALVDYYNNNKTESEGENAALAEKLTDIAEFTNIQAPGFN